MAIQEFKLPMLNPVQLATEKLLFKVQSPSLLHMPQLMSPESQNNKSTDLKGSSVCPCVFIMTASEQVLCRKSD